MKKAAKIEALTGVSAAGTGSLDPRYSGYFECFNEQRYFEAHDVLEHLWLRTEGADRAFFKGLIQLAGAFVHLQKQFGRPEHPKDAGRAKPAARLLKLAAGNLEGYQPHHMGLDVTRVWTLCTGLAEQIRTTNFSNPWSPKTAPVLKLEHS